MVDRFIVSWGQTLIPILMHKHPEVHAGFHRAVIWHNCLYQLDVLIIFFLLVKLQ